MPPCTRRRVLHASGVALSLALAGCSGERERRGTTKTSRIATPTTAPPEPTTSTPTTSESTSSVPTTDEPTPNTPLPTPEQEYRFGEWHLADPWKLTVAELELSTTFRTEDGETYEMPDDEQLLVVTAWVENVDSTRRGYSGALDGLIDGRVYEDDSEFEHPAFEHGVLLNELAQIRHIARYRPHAHQIDPGETVTSWLAWAIPRSVAREDVRIGYDPENDGSYPIRWVPP